MIGEVISIGDELASGERLDTNSQWLSQRLTELGVPVVFHTTVADDSAANIAVFRAAVARADIVVATGGLGPTADDLTRDAIAAAAGVDLELNAASLAHIEALFARFGRAMPERNRLQAMFPRGARPIANPSGTAPGIAMPLLRADGGVCHVFALPGVPAEMREMFAASVAPAVAALAGSRMIRHRRIKCFGQGESHVEKLLGDLIRRGREPSVGITVHDATITLRVTAAGATTQECDEATAPTLALIRDSLGELVFGEEDDELELAVVRLLAQRKETLATVEVGTAGVLANWLAVAAAGSGTYVGGVVAAAVSEDGLPANARDPSRAAAEALAADCRRRFAADYALAIGAFPPPSQDASPATYYFALASAERVQVHSSTLAGHPSIWRPRAAKQALNLLRLWLLRDAASDS